MADTKQLISDFYRVAANRDFARDVHFRLLSLNTGGVTSVTFNEDDLVYIKAAALPARAINNIAVPFMGLKFNVPGLANYPGSDGYELKFYADAKSQIRQKFEDWSRAVFDDATSTGNYFTPRQTSVLDMIQLDTQMNKVAQYQLVGVSVLDVGALSYQMATGTGETLEFTAKISYHYWKRK